MVRAQGGRDIFSVLYAFSLYLFNVYLFLLLSSCSCSVSLPLNLGWFYMLTLPTDLIQAEPRAGQFQDTMSQLLSRGNCSLKDTSLGIWFTNAIGFSRAIVMKKLKKFP